MLKLCEVTANTAFISLNIFTLMMEGDTFLRNHKASAFFNLHVIQKLQVHTSVGAVVFWCLQFSQPSQRFATAGGLSADKTNSG
jgi:hypothetical protein